MKKKLSLLCTIVLTLCMISGCNIDTTTPVGQFYTGLENIKSAKSFKYSTSSTCNMGYDYIFANGNTSADTLTILYTSKQSGTYKNRLRHANITETTEMNISGDISKLKKKREYYIKEKSGFFTQYSKKKSAKKWKKLSYKNELCLNNNSLYNDPITDIFKDGIDPDVLLSSCSNVDISTAVSATTDEATGTSTLVFDISKLTSDTKKTICKNISDYLTSNDINDGYSLSEVINPDNLNELTITLVLSSDNFTPISEDISVKAPSLYSLTNTETSASTIISYNNYNCHIDFSSYNNIKKLSIPKKVIKNSK